MSKKKDEKTLKEIEKKLKIRLSELSAELDEDEEVLSEQLPANSTEAAPLRNDLDVTQADNDRDNEEINDIRDALDAIASGDYGECKECNQGINPERLLAMPHARLCIACQEEKEKNER